MNPAFRSASYTHGVTETLYENHKNEEAGNGLQHQNSLILNQYRRHSASLSAAPIRGSSFAIDNAKLAKSISWSPDSPKKAKAYRASKSERKGFLGKILSRIEETKYFNVKMLKNNKKEVSLHWLSELLKSLFSVSWFMLACVVVVGYKFFSDGSFSAILTLASAFQCFSLALLNLKVTSQQSVIGVSSRSLFLIVISTLARLCSTLFYNGYLPVDRSGDYVYQFADILTVALAVALILYARRFCQTSIQQQQDKDTCVILAPLAVAFVLAAILHPTLNQHAFADIAWTFALYTETFAMVPQLFLMTKLGGEVEALTSHYVASMGASKIFAFLFWYFSYGELTPRHGGRNFAGWAVIFAYSSQTLLLADFFYGTQACSLLTVHAMLMLGLLVMLLCMTTTRCQPTMRGGIIASTLRLSTVDNRTSTLIFGSGENEVRMSSAPDSGLLVQTPTFPLLKFKSDGTIEISAQQTVIKSSLDIEGLFRVHGVGQWRLVHSEDFSTKKAIGWDNKNPDIITECAGIFMLGGYGKFAKGEISKRITDLPVHSQVRYRANFHFIDAWIGETGFMRTNIGKDGSMVHVWTDRHKQDTEAFAVNVCGAGTGEGKFSVPIDVAFPHSTDNIIVGFGSTIETDDPMDQSWGISGLEVYVR